MRIVFLAVAVVLLGISAWGWIGFLIYLKLHKSFMITTVLDFFAVTLFGVAFLLLYYSLWFLGATCIAATVAALHPLYRSLAHITRNRRDGLEVLVGNYKKRLLRREGTARAKQMRREGSTDREILDMLRQLARKYDVDINEDRDP